MADVKYRKLGLDYTEWVSFARSMQCDILTIDEADHICIGDVYRIKFNAILGKLFIYENEVETSVTIGGDPDKDDYTEITITCTSDFVWLTIYNKGHNYYPPKSCCFFYEILGGMILYSYRYISSNNATISFAQIQSVTDKVTGYTYTHTPVIQFDAESNMISTSNQVLTKEGLKIVTDPNLISCTTVETGKVIMFDNHDYYAIGPHTLVPIWDDPE